MVNNAHVVSAYGDGIHHAADEKEQHLWLIQKIWKVKVINKKIYFN